MSMDDSSSTAAVRDTDMSDASADDHDMQLDSASADPSNLTDVNRLLGDQSFMSSILASLPGVDLNDPHVKYLLASMQNQSEKKEEDKPPKEDETK